MTGENEAVVTTTAARQIKKKTDVSRQATSRVPVDVLCGDKLAQVGAHWRYARSLEYGSLAWSVEVSVQLTCNQDDATLHNAAVTAANIAKSEVARMIPYINRQLGLDDDTAAE